MKLRLKAIVVIFILSGIGAMSLMTMFRANADQGGAEEGQIETKNEETVAEDFKPFTGTAKGGPDIVTYVDVPTEFKGYATSPGSMIVKYTWDFDGDGKFDYESADSGTTSYAFPQPGKYEAAFKAFDAAGAETPLSIARVIVRGGKGRPEYLAKENLDRSNPEKLKGQGDSFRKQANLSLEEERFLGIDMDPAAPPEEAVSGTTLLSPDGALSPDGTKKTYVVMVNGASESRFWDDVTYTYDMFHTAYAIPESDIYLLSYNGSNPSGQNPNGMIDYAATKGNLQAVLSVLAAIVDGDDTFYFWVTDHGNGYIGPVQRSYSQSLIYGYLAGKASVDSGDEQDYLESDFKLRALCTNGDYAAGNANHGMGMWKTYRSYISSTRTYYYRHKYVSHFDNVNFTQQGLQTDNDIYVEEFKDYLQGDTNKDGVIDTSLGETLDYNGNGVAPYSLADQAYDEGDWGEIDSYGDNVRVVNTAVPEGFSYTYTILDIGLDDRLDIDLNHDPLHPEANGTDSDNNGLFDGLDVNDDGDKSDWISIDEVICLYGSNLYDDELRSYLQPISAGSVVIILEPCFSGGFIEDLSRSNTVIMTATEEETVSWGNRFVRNVASALSGLTYIDSSGNPSLVDANNDGRKDMVEIFNFAAANDYGSTWEIPQYDDNGDGLPHPSRLPAGGDGYLGETITLAPVPVAAGSVSIDNDAAFTNSVYVVLNVAAISTMTHMRFSNDGVTFSALEPLASTRPWTLPDGDGVKKVYVGFADADGLGSETYYDTIVLDTASPTVYAPQTVSPTGSQRPVWNWQPAIDSGSGASGIYEFYLGTTSGGSQLVHGQSVSATNYAYPTDLSFGTYYAYITTTDNAGNLTISTVSPVVIGDLTAPIIAITSPANNSNVSKNKTITIQADATDSVGVTRVVFSVNGTVVCIDMVAAYACSWKVPAQPGKTYNLQTSAYDAAGNVGNSAVIRVTSK